MEIDFKELRTVEEFKTTISFHLALNGGDPPLEPEEMTREFLRAMEHDYRQFGIYSANELIGIFSLSMRYCPTYFKPGCEMNGLIVAEEHRSKGIGAKAMKFVEEWAIQNGAGFVRFFVDTQNTGAIDFYVREGYRHSSNYMYKVIV